MADIWKVGHAYVKEGEEFVVSDDVQFIGGEMAGGRYHVVWIEYVRTAPESGDKP